MGRGFPGEVGTGGGLACGFGGFGELWIVVSLIVLFGVCCVFLFAIRGCVVAGDN